MYIKSITSKLNYGYGTFKRVTEFGKYKDMYIAIEKDYKQDKLVNKTFIFWNNLVQIIREKRLTK